MTSKDCRPDDIYDSDEEEEEDYAVDYDDYIKEKLVKIKPLNES